MRSWRGDLGHLGVRDETLPEVELAPSGNARLAVLPDHDCTWGLFQWLRPFPNLVRVL